MSCFAVDCWRMADTKNIFWKFVIGVIYFNAFYLQELIKKKTIMFESKYKYQIFEIFCILKQIFKEKQFFFFVVNNWLCFCSVFAMNRLKMFYEQLHCYIDVKDVKHIMFCCKLLAYGRYKKYLLKVCYWNNGIENTIKKKMNRKKTKKEKIPYVKCKFNDCK